MPPTTTTPPPGQTPRAAAAQATNILIGTAIVWWANRRPLSYTMAEHLENPAVNTISPAEAELAQAVAGWIRTCGGAGPGAEWAATARVCAPEHLGALTRARTPLDAARAACGFTVPQLALLLDVPVRSVYHWCAGSHHPRGKERAIVETWLQLVDCASPGDIQEMRARLAELEAAAAGEPEPTERSC